ncbi:MAG TPA: hypothetical protein V6C85_32090 [Allocoleopsis sp.]
MEIKMDTTNSKILIRVEISNCPSKPRLDFYLYRIPYIGEEIELEEGRLLKVCRVIHIQQNNMGISDIPQAILVVTDYDYKNR